MKRPNLLFHVAVLAFVASACSPLATTSTTTTAPASPPDGGDAATTVAALPKPTVPLPPPPGICESFQEPATTGSISREELTEVSGIVTSRTYPGTLWMHNDSGGGAVIYASDLDGNDLGAFAIDAPAFDWEDIAIGPGPDPGTDYLFVGDIGDNLHFRPTVTVYRFVEPRPDPEGGAVGDVATIDLAYPEPGFDSEALLVDPVTGDLVIVTKPDGDDAALIFRAPAADLVDGARVDLIPVGRFPLEAGTFVTGADIDRTGAAIVLRGYNEVWLWKRTDLDFTATFAAPPCRTPSTAEVQGEAIAFAADGFTYYTVSEGRSPDINVVVSRGR